MSHRIRIAGAFSGLLMLAACSAPSPADSPSSGPPSDPIAQMEIAFEGTPRKSEITSAMDRALGAIGEVPTADIYRRAGSVLVSFRKEYGVSEMDILKCMPYRANDSRAPEKNFPNVAAVCLTDLASGVKVP